jgi:hypothetical protein
MRLSSQVQMLQQVARMGRAQHVVVAKIEVCNQFFLFQRAVEVEESMHAEGGRGRFHPLPGKTVGYFPGCEPHAETRLEFIAMSNADLVVLRMDFRNLHFPQRLHQAS